MRVVSIPSPRVGWKNIGSFAFVLMACAPLLQAATLVHDFYLPMPEAQLRQTMTALETGISTNLDCTFSVVVTGSGTIIYYDQWEDGYEIDLAHPSQPTTQIWGDGNNLNGIPPGFVNDPAGLPAGTALTLRNIVPLPRNPANLLFDGRDRVAATKALVVSRLAWPVSPGAVLADAAQIPATIDWGVNYVSPVGQDLTNALFQYVALFVMAGADNTAVTIDSDGAGGTAPFNVVLNRGESYFVNGGIKKGATVTASKPVQAELVTGKIAAHYASDWFTLQPVESWGSTYTTPVPTPNSGNSTYVFLYNPATNALTINFTTRVGSGSFVVSSNGVYSFIMPQGSGAQFASAGGGKFFALCTVAAKPGSEAAYDWGFTLLPSDALTTEAVVGLGLGSADGSVNGSPVWVAPLIATRIYVDYNGDRAGPLMDPNGGKYDVAFDLVALQTQKIYEPDKNQTGMRLYTLDGSLFSTAWGEDADVASPGNPYIDAGTAVLPFPVPVLRKAGAIFTDVNPPGLSIGDTLEYTVELDNKGLLPLGNTVLVDAPSAGVTYVPNSTTQDGNAVADSVSGTPFPLDAPGYTIPLILRGGTTTFKYRMTVTAAGSISNYVSAVGYGIAAQSTLVPTPPGGSTQCALDFTDASGVPLAAYSAGASVFVNVADNDANSASNSAQSVSVVVSNLTRGDYEVVTLAETGNNTGIFRNAAGLPSSTSSGLGLNDGTLNVTAGDILTVRYTDPIYFDTCTASASVQAPAQTKVLYLSDPGQALDRVNPVAANDNTTAQSIELGGGVAGTVVVDAASSGNSTSNTLTIVHTTGAGTNRLMLVGIAYDKGGAAIASVTYNGQSLTNVINVDNTSGPVKPRADIWQLVNPASGSHNLVITFSGASGIDASAGVVTFSGVDQATPIGTGNTAIGNSTAASVTVTAAAGEVVFDTVAIANSATATAGAGQTGRWSTNTANIRGAGSTKAGAASVPMAWVNGSARWASVAVPIKPAGAGGANITTFSQSPAFCQNFLLPAGGAVTVTNFVTVTSGVMPANPSITGQLRFGTTNVITLTNPSYTAANSNLVWTGTLGGSLTIPAGQALDFIVSNAQSGVSFRLDFDSVAKPAKITLPTTTVIQVGSVGVYDAPYPGGSLVTTPVAGTTLYVRAAVSDPFGSYDISSVGLVIDGPGTSGDITTTLTNSSVVADDGCTRVYQYVWQTGTTVGFYNIAATGNEGSEGITASAATSVQLTFLDLGTPSTTEFTTGNNGAATNAFAANASACVRVSDLDQNQNPAVAETLAVTVTSSSGDSENLTLTETSTNSGIFTACLNTSTNAGAGLNNGTLLAPRGAVLTASYTDPVDFSDESSATATILTAPGTPGIVMNKTLLAPADGQAGIGETVTYNLQVVNTGSTPLTNVLLTDNFPVAKLSFQSASLAPSSTNAGTLTWASFGNFAPGQSTNVTVSFTAIATAAPAVNSATARSTGVVTNTGTVGVAITHAALTITKTVLTPTNSPINNIGSNITFRIIVQNSGDTAIPSLPLEDTFSAGCFQFVSATVPPDGTGAGSLFWADITGAGSLASNASLTIDVTLKVTGGCDPANNTAHADYAVDVNGDPVPTATSTIGVTTGAGRITGAIYNDPDQSGTFTPGDTGLANVDLKLYSDPNADGDPSDGTLLQLVTTGSSGTYELLNLTTGAYVVVETDLPGYASVAPLNNRLPVVLTALTTNANNNFFDYLVPPVSYATINGTVWADTNANSLVDGGDYGLANVAIELIQDVNTNGFADSGETVTASATTAANGAYSFTGVAAGNYVVRETDPYGWISTADSRPPNDNQIALYVAAGATTNGNDFLDFFTGNNPGNDAPVAANDTYSTLEDTPLNLAAPGVLGNDIDVDGDPLTAVLVSPTTHGTLNLSTNGGFLYTPFTNYNGPDSFTYRANDGTTNSGVATVNLTVLPVNDAPLANNDAASTAKNLSVSVPVLVNDSDPEGNPLLIVSVSPTNGTALISSTNVVFTPATNFIGTATVGYTISDGNGGTNSALITITVFNTAPIANNQSVTTPEDTATNLVLTASDVDGDSLTFSIVTPPAQGVLSLLNTITGTVTYTPATNYNGADSFTFRVNDGTTNSPPATVSITVTPANDAPVAINQSITTPEDTATNLVLTATDVDSTNLVFALLGTPTNGVLSGFNTNTGALTYTPSTNYFGPDFFRFTVTDGSLLATGQVSITVTPLNDPPIANNQSVTTPEDTATNLVLTATDVDSTNLVFALLGTPTNGVLTGFNTNTGALTYTPSTNYFGPDLFRFTVSDGSLLATGQVSITVTPVNDAPIANSQSVTTPEDTATNLVLTASDVDSTNLVFALLGTPTNGVLTGFNTNTGALTYTPNTNYFGPDFFRFTVTDGSLLATGQVSITVTPLNDAPIANNQSVTTPEDTATNLVLTASDMDGDLLTFSIVTPPTQGVLSLLNTNTGTVTYTPATNYNGADSFTFRVNDGTTNSQTATVSITVTPANDAPVAINQSVITPEDTATNLVLTATDVDSTNLVFALLGTPTNGVLTGFNTNTGALTYTPSTNYFGPDFFRFTVTDGSLLATGQVSITVTPLNDAPVAINQSVTTPEDTATNLVLAASDVDSTNLVFALLGNPTNGVLTGFNTNTGALTYTPSTNYFGPDFFRFTVSDGSLLATGQVSITVTPVNDAPVANSQSVTMPEDATTNLVLTASDVDGDPLTFVIVTPPLHGALTLLNTNTGTVTYTPATNYNGADSFTFRVNDGTTNSQTATVSITVTPVNDAPVANNDAYSLFKNTTLTISAPGVLGNDLDVENDPFTVLLGANVTHGTLNLSSNGGFVYTPVSNYVGGDSFTYRVTDGGATSSVATVTLTISATNTPPVASNDSFTTLEDTTLTIPAAGVLTNDFDADADPLTALLVANVTNGALTLNTNGGFSYTPATNYHGTDTFTYRASDGLTTSGVATVTLTITPVNDAPVAISQNVTTPEVTATNLVLTATDVDSTNLVFALLGTPTNGVLSGFNTNTGTLTYTPSTNYFGPDFFRFTVTDGSLLATGQVSITVTPVNDAPIANSQSITTPEDTATNLVLAASDVDSTNLVFALLGTPTNGVVSGFNTNTGTLTYTPSTNYFGPDFFRFTVTDGSLLATGQVSITVTPVNDAPIANNQSVTTPEDTATNLVLTASDVDGDLLTFSIVTPPTQGVLSLLNTNTGTVTYTPATNYNGADSFTFRVNDGTTNSQIATVSITVTPVNDAPIAVNDNYNLFKNTTLTVPASGVLTNDFDVDNNPLVALIASGVAHGTLNLSSNGGFIYTPVSNYVGSDSFTYRANDGLTNSGLATVTLTIAATNTPPVAVDDTYPAFSTAQLIISAPGVLTNDFDVDGDALTAVIAGTPSHGVVTLNPNGSFTYTPTNNYAGPDSFTYRANDGFTNSGIATVNVTVAPRADVAVLKMGALAGFAGSNLTFTITVTNSGPSTASNVVVFDQLPAAYTFVSAVPAAASVSNNLVRWAATHLPNAGSASFTVTATPTNGGVFTNIASSTSSTVDLNPTNNDGSATNSRVITSVQPLADVAVFKTGAGSVIAGGSVTYSITATNSGPSAATNVVVRDTLPVGVTLSNASSGYSLSNGVVSWTIATLANGATSNYTVTIIVPASGSLTNIASATSDTPDPIPGNNNGSALGSRATTTITPLADVAVFKTGAADVGSGTTFTYTITVTNRGPSAASNVIVRDLLPTNLVFVGASAGGVFASNTVTWPAIASLPNGGTATYTLTNTAPLNGSFTNRVTATATTADSDASNNDGTASGSQVVTTVIAGQFSLLSGPIVFNPQTGLFEQRATVTNTSGATVAGVQLLVGNLRGTNGVPRTNVFLYNASGTNFDGRPYVQYNSPLNPGSNVTFTLEFYVPDRKPFTNTLEAQAFIPGPAGTNAGAGVLIDHTFMDLRLANSPRFVIEWASVPGKTYTIIYSDTGSAPWFVATPSVTANANRTQWYDDGPPKTASNPMAIPSRFYRVIVAP